MRPADTGVPDRDRTCNPQLRRLVLYPLSYGHNSLSLVGVERFELPTSCSQSRRATRLRYTPKAAHYTDANPEINSEIPHVFLESG